MKTACESELQEIKTDFELFDRRVRDLERRGSGYVGLCPLHNDHHPSLTINQRGGHLLFYCPVCDEGGSVIDLAMAISHCDEGEAIRALKEELSMPRGHARVPVEAPLTEAPPIVFAGTDEQIREYGRALADDLGEWTSCETENFLKGSGLLGVASELNFGYDCARHFADQKSHPALVFPFYWDQKLVGVQFRNLESSDSANKWTRLTGSKNDFLWFADRDPVDPYSRIVGVFEGVRDTALARALGFNSVGFISTSSVPKREPSERYKESIQRVQQTYSRAVIIGDNDEPGKEAKQRLRSQLGQIASLASVPEPCKDLSEYHEKHGADETKALLGKLYGIAGATIEGSDPFESSEYPLWAWENTAYADFARACTKDNFIPPEFVIESLKTVIGGIAGHRLGVEGSEIEARFYTVLIGGTGKSTTLGWVMEAFPPSLVYHSGAPLWPDLGCHVGGVGSQVGILETAKDHQQILIHYDEFSTLAEKFRIPGSGQSLLAEINKLYEKSLPPSNATRQQVSDIKHRVHTSILGATTPDVWLTTFGETGTEGSGFFQRLNIVGSDETRSVERLRKPDLTPFEPLVSKVKALKDQAYELPMTQEADELLRAWYTRLTKQFGTSETGRLQVLALRTAAHLGWLLDVRPGQQNKITPQEVIRRACAIAGWQVLMRRKYAPVFGDNPYSRTENLMQRVISQQRVIMRSRLFREINGSRVGRKIFNNSLDMLAKEGLIRMDKIHGGRQVAQMIYWVGEDEQTTEADS